jgi:hypothetical protein
MSSLVVLGWFLAAMYYSYKDKWSNFQIFVISFLYFIFVGPLR